MRIALGKAPKKAIRLALSPFRKIGNGIKSSAQRFVMKTIQRNGGSIGPTNASGSLGSDVLIDLLRTTQNTEHTEASAPYRGVNIGKYILTQHPHAKHFFFEPSIENYPKSPGILSGSFEVEVCAWINQNITSEQKVAVLNAEEGYHALSLLSKLNCRENCLLASRESDDETLALNLSVNHMRDSNHIASGILNDDLSEDCILRLQRFKADVVIVQNSPKIAERISQRFADLMLVDIRDGAVRVTDETKTSATNIEKAA